MNRDIPIGTYGLIGDTRTAALVARDGAIDWWCAPRFDAAPVFGRLVGGDDAGTFVVTPADPVTASAQRYRPDTATLETTWQVGGAEIVLADGMIAEVAGRLLPSTVLVRQVRVQGRAATVRVALSPRFGYAKAPARRVRRRAGAAIVEHGDLALALTCDAEIDWTADRSTTVEVSPDRPVTFVVSVAHRAPAVIIPPAVARANVERDERGWRRWAAGIHAPRHRDPVVRSLLTLQLLTYSPSGAPVAAPTTSLPEAIGEGRNWDYRYAWPRDASIGVAAFLAAGKHNEARGFLAWLLHASRLRRPRLSAMFDLVGRPVPAERELPSWSGYRGSRPVRVGNSATDQHQLDGYGWVIDAATLYERAGHRLDGETWRAVGGFADHLTATWRDPDAGIWERRDRPRHHVHSKLMAWLGLDRAVELAASRGPRAARRGQRWRAARDQLAEEIRHRGFDPAIGAYTAAYDSDGLDASCLLLPIIGFDPPESPRVAGTIEAIRRQLSAGGPLLYRYVDDDGLPGREGAFLPCSFWLVQALASIGRQDEAEALFDELITLGGPLGLYAEEMDPSTRDHLGNYPQALTHATLLQAALALESPRPSTAGREDER